MPQAYQYRDNLKCTHLRSFQIFSVLLPEICIDKRNEYTRKHA